MECFDLLNRKMFLLRVKPAVYKRYVRLAILLGSNACLLNECLM